MSTSVDLSRLASGIIEHFTGKLADQQAVAPALTQTFADFEAHTAGMVGQAGYQALAQRALYLTHSLLKNDPAVSAIALPRLPEQSWMTMVEQLGEPAACRYAAALLGQLLGLLGAFIGEDLTVGLVGRTWPELDVSALSSTSGEG